MSIHYSSAQVVKRRILNRIIWMIFVLLMFFVGAASFYYRGPILLAMQPVFASLQQVKMWLVLQKKAVSQTVISANTSTDKATPVHFEFYSALSDAEMSVQPSAPTHPQRDKQVRTADNAKAALPPVAFSQDDLVKEFEEKLDKS